MTVRRVCRLRLFKLSIFPRSCLRTSLTLVRFLPAMGFPVRLHIGVRQDGPRFAVHSWVTLDQQPLPGEVSAGYRVLYTYP